MESNFDKNDKEVPEKDYIVPIEKDAEEKKLFNAFMIDLTTKPHLWNPTRRERPNFKSMGLNIRALQNAGVVEHNVPAFDHGSENPHVAFCESLHAQDFANPEAAKDYKDKEHELFLDTMRRAGGVFTTLSNSADKFLMEAKKIELVVIDEGAQSTELECLLPWINNCETVKLVIIVGDPKQLNATVKTADQNKRDEVVNPFASQLQLSMFERLQNLGFPVSLFIENFRVTEGLEQLSNGLFYDNKITNADCTKLAVRPKSQEAIKFIKEEYNVVTQVPHVCLHVPKGAT